MTWTPAPSGPPPLVRHAMASDGGSAVVLFGGNSGNGAPTTTCWIWDRTWRACVGPLPPARNDGVMAVGANRGEVVLYGGTQMLEIRGTWRWTASGWTDLQQPGPPNATNPVMAYDPAAREHVLFYSGGLTQTYTLDAAGWTAKEESASARDNATMVYDPDRGTMVVFGGVDVLIGTHNETFERDATGWSEVAVGIRPGPRADVWRLLQQHHARRHLDAALGIGHDRRELRHDDGCRRRRPRGLRRSGLLGTLRSTLSTASVGLRSGAAAMR